jgi:Txe/YoeB family toxin of Txe-Axe toxin-antitoxin module
MVMDVMSYTSFRSKLAQKMKEICENHLGLIVTRKNNKHRLIYKIEEVSLIILQFRYHY